MRALLSLLALSSIAAATSAEFYPKATGQGEAVSTNKDSARFSVNCSKHAPEDYQKPIRGGIKVIVKTLTGVTRTIDMPEVDDAVFFYGQCTMTGPGTLDIDYGKGKVSKYQGVVRAILSDRASDGKGHGADELSISFQSKDLKIPQANFQGKVTTGRIQVTHLPMTMPTRAPARAHGDNSPPPPPRS